MKFAITPCPNDTFSYHALVSKILKSDLEFVFEDIETLNLEAKRGTYPITKMSFAAYLECSDKYCLLNAGAALGIGTGPVLVVCKGAKFNPQSPVLVPGLNTTGALLLRYKYGKIPNMKAAYFRDIASMLERGDFNAGVLIHEGRFVFESQGLELVADLGAHWTNSTNLPVPLGCICIRRDFIERASDIENLIRDSIKIAFVSPSVALPYVKSMAQYLADDVLEKHIYAFVNDYSLDISHIKDKLLRELKKC